MSEEQQVSERVGTLSIEEANELVLENQGWAESIARSVARSWNLDWRNDGLDGAAMEALIFCSRRFDPSRGVPFRGYARKRIHEGSTEAARKCKGWRKASSSSRVQQSAREISVELLDIFPELRSGQLPGGEDGDPRSGIRNLLMGASLIAEKQGVTNALPDDIIDYKRVVNFIATMEVVHQVILFKIYWEGLSMRSIASDWDTDELNVIREHKVLLQYLHKCVAKGPPSKAVRVRPGLKQISLQLKRKHPIGPFSKLVGKG